MNTAGGIRGERVYFLDNARTAMVFLVVMVHAGFVYDYALAEIWIVSDPMKNLLLFRIFMVIDIFLMPVLFFVAGYFSRLSIERKTGWNHLASKAARLLIPWAIAALVLIPAYKMIFLCSRGLPRESPLAYFHFTRTMTMNQGWLWFLPVLFLFNLLYVLIAKVLKIDIRISLTGAVAVMFIVAGAYTYAMYSLRLLGWTKTIVLDFQNERVPIYFMAYLFGAFSGKKRIFDAPPKIGWKYCIALLPAILATASYARFQWKYLVSGGLRFVFSEKVDPLIISLSYAAAALSLSYVVLETFRLFLNRSSKVLGELNANSYGVYIIHFVVTGVVALLLLPLLLSAIGKWIVLTAATYALSNFLVALYRRATRRFFVSRKA